MPSSGLETVFDVDLPLSGITHTIMQLKCHLQLEHKAEMPSTIVINIYLET